MKQGNRNHPLALKPKETYLSNDVLDRVARDVTKLAPTLTVAQRKRAQIIARELLRLAGEP